jgi:hypothetical protein
LKKVERRLVTTLRSMTRVIIMGTTESGKRRILKRESELLRVRVRVRVRVRFRVRVRVRVRARARATPDQP